MAPFGFFHSEIGIDVKMVDIKQFVMNSSESVNVIYKFFSLP